MIEEVLRWLYPSDLIIKQEYKPFGYTESDFINTTTKVSCYRSIKFTKQDYISIDSKVLKYVHSTEFYDIYGGISESKITTEFFYSDKIWGENLTERVISAVYSVLGLESESWYEQHEY